MATVDRKDAGDFSTLESEDDYTEEEIDIMMEKNQQRLHQLANLWLEMGPEESTKVIQQLAEANLIAPVQQQED